MVEEEFMSILIRGMEMPKSCNECLMSIEYACMINGNIIPNYWARLDRPTDCPLVELPPHGQILEWIPIKTRPMTNEELKYWEELYEYGLSEEEAVIYCSPLPKDGQEVLVCSEYGYIWLDTFCDDVDSIGFETNGDMDGIIAWMPLPAPYKKEAEVAE